MKSSIAFLLFIFPLILDAQSGLPNDKRVASLDTAFERVLETWKAPGFAVAVVEKNKVIYAKGFGFRNVEKKLPVTPNTLFAIGSCTKAFTTSLIGILQKEDKLDIDKPASQYHPELAFFNDELTNNVTLRDMMSHRTGLPRHDFSWYLFGTESRDSLFRRIGYQEPTFPLRRQWQYNNFMFVAQGSIAEQLTGKSWEENIKEKILLPLNMTNTVFSVHEMEKSDNGAYGYGLEKDSIIIRLPYYDIVSAGPAGSINSSVNEMANWVITWINGGKFKDSEIIPSSFAREAISSQQVVGSGLPNPERPDMHFSNYGFGWFLSSYKGHYRVEHGGNIDGFSASTSFFPTDSIGIIVLVNQNASPVPSIVRNIIADRLLGKPYYDHNGDNRRTYLKNKKEAEEAEKTKTSAQKKGTSPSHDLNAYEGIYNHPGYGTMDVFVRNDSLFAHTTTKLLWLKHYHYDQFSPYMIDDPRFDPEEEVSYRLQFNTGLTGEIASLNAIGFESPKIELEFKKTPKEKPISKSALEEYGGIYVIAGTEIKIYTKGDALHMMVPGQPEYEFISTDKDKFALKDLSGYSVQFLRDSNGKINAVNLIQPNGTFKAEKKTK